MAESFYAVQAIPKHSDDFELIGVFTRESDANEFVAQQEASGRYQMVVRPEHLEMQVILDLLVKDRLRELAAPVIAIASDQDLLKSLSNLVSWAENTGYFSAHDPVFLATVHEARDAISKAKACRG